MKTLCAALMVKNEEKVIVRCLNSIKDLVDFIFIVDTGSSDNTINVIRNYLSENNLKGEVVERPWINFGANKTETLQLIKNKFDYVLWLDADEIIINNNFNKENLTADAYHLHYADNLDYARIYVFNNRIDWNFVGVIHTYPLSPQSKTCGNLPELKIKHFNDGGNHDDKTQKAINLLKQGVIDEPNNSRYYFYLGQSYRELGKYQEAMDYYLKTITLSKWTEEIFYSKYMIGICTEHLKEYEYIKQSYLTAWEYRPTRAEPLYRLAVLCRNHKEYNQAYKFAKMGLEISYPTDLLFIERNIYKYLLAFELSISAYYVGQYSESIENCNKIIKMDEVPEELKNQAKINIKFSEEKLRNENL